MNTRSKRASALGLALPFVMHLPLAAGAIAQAARQHLAHLYVGILASGPPVGGTAPGRSGFGTGLGFRRF